MDFKNDYDNLPMRYPELKGKVAIITGSSRGIGRGTAMRLAREGMRVVITGLEADLTENTARSLHEWGAHAIGIPGNLKETAHIADIFEKTMAEFGQVDVLVNNAADLRRSNVLDMTDDVLDASIAINLRAPLLASRYAAEIMKEAGGGNIVSISSVGGLRAHNLSNPYDATKSGIDGMTRGLAVDLAAHKIRVNAVAPGAIMTEATLRFLSERPDGLDEIFERIPLARGGTVYEIGAMIAYLVSDDAAYITGQVIYVDGGITMQLSPPGQAL